MDNVYVWYSDATDITGKKLIDELKCSGGKEAPDNKKIDTIICWGTKTAAATKLPAHIKNVFNHPDNIRVNRNKVKALQLLKDGKCSVAKFSEDFKVEAANWGMSFPIVARSKFHQGGEGFWLCLNKEHVRLAKIEGAEYLQEFIHTKDEYRLHILNDELIYAAKKTLRDNMADAFVEAYTEKINNWAEKNKVVLDKETMKKVLLRVARSEAEKANHIIKSNTKGWKFIQVKNPPAELIQQAKLALKALKFSYGAVDCCMDIHGKAWILEVNSGPGLEAATLKACIDALKKTIDAVKVKEKKVEAKKNIPAEVQPAAFVANKAAKVDNNKGLKHKLAMMQKLVDVADENETAVLEKLWAKIME